jgi:hypothetical protein
VKANGYAIDPSRNSILYLGVHGGFGLRRSTDFGRTWAQVTSFPNPGDFIPDPGDTSGYSSDNAGVLQTVFDKRGTERGKPTQTIYVTVADTENILYRSTDAGRTWARCRASPPGSSRTRWSSIPSADTSTSPRATPSDRMTAPGAMSGSWKPAPARGRASVPSTDSSAAFRLQRAGHRPAAPGHVAGRHPDHVVGRTSRCTAAPTPAPAGRRPGTGERTRNVFCAIPSTSRPRHG